MTGISRHGKDDGPSLCGDDRIGQFSLFGGPLHRCGRRLRLLGVSRSTVPLGLVLGAGLWLVLVLLSTIEGTGAKLWSLSTLGGHVRLLLVIPLLFAAETLFDPRVREWLGMLMRYRIVPDGEQPQLVRAMVRTTGLSSSWIAELALLLVAASMSVPGLFALQFGATAFYDPKLAAGVMNLTAAWYWFVALTVFRFLVLRWLWRLGLWWHLLWVISRLQLRLIPTHPDRAGGLGYLEVVQGQLLPLVVAMSALHAAVIAEEIVMGLGSFDALYPALLITLGIGVALLIGPMFLFLGTMWTHRVDALQKYMGLAAVFVDRFHQTWAAPSDVVPDDLVNTGQWSTLTDMGTSVTVIREMRAVPVSTRLLTEVTIAAVVPALPLLLLKYPVSELAAKVFAQILGV